MASTFTTRRSLVALVILVMAGGLAQTDQSWFRVGWSSRLHDMHSLFWELEPEQRLARHLELQSQGGQVIHWLAQTSIPTVGWLMSMAFSVRKGGEISQKTGLQRFGLVAVTGLLGCSSLATAADHQSTTDRDQMTGVVLSSPTAGTAPAIATPPGTVAAKLPFCSPDMERLFPERPCQTCKSIDECDGNFNVMGSIYGGKVRACTMDSDTSCDLCGEGSYHVGILGCYQCSESCPPGTLRTAPCTLRNPEPICIPESQLFKQTTPSIAPSPENNSADFGSQSTGSQDKSQITAGRESSASRPEQTRPHTDQMLTTVSPRSPAEASGDGPEPNRRPTSGRTEQLPATAPQSSPMETSGNGMPPTYRQTTTLADAMPTTVIARSTVKGPGLPLTHHQTTTRPESTPEEVAPMIVGVKVNGTSKTDDSIDWPHFGTPVVVACVAVAVVSATVTGVLYALRRKLCCRSPSTIKTKTITDAEQGGKEEKKTPCVAQSE